MATATKKIMGGSVLAVSMAEAARMTSLSKGTIKAYVLKGKIKGIKIGRRTIIAISVLEDLVRNGVC